MGLDSYFVTPDQKDPTNFEKDGPAPEVFWSSRELIPRLCGGMFSGNGASGSFRGKVYAGLIESLTGQNIYQRQSNEEVQRIAEGLTCYAMFKDREEILNDDFTEDLFQLIVMFDKYAKAGAALEAWY